MYRPNYFVVRIDSKWGLGWRDENGPDIWLDDVYESIESDIPEWPWAEKYGLKFDEDGNGDCSSRTSFNEGSEWGPQPWPVPIKKK